MDEMVPQGSWYKNSKMGITLVTHSVICLNCVLYTRMVRIEYQVREMQKVRASKSFPRSASKLWVITPTFSPSTPPPPRLIFDHNWLAFFAKQYVCCMYVHGLLVQWSRVSMARRQRQDQEAKLEHIIRSRSSTKWPAFLGKKIRKVNFAINMTNLIKFRGNIFPYMVFLHSNVA